MYHLFNPYQNKTIVGKRIKYMFSFVLACSTHLDYCPICPICVEVYIVKYFIQYSIYIIICII